MSTSGSLRISSRCSAGRSAFFALNSVGARFGCLHPITSHKLYAYQLCCMGLSSGPLTKSDLNMLERTHRKILRTIQGLPTRCPSLALTSLIGSLGISSLVDCRQLCFVNSIACMSSEDLPKRVMLERLLADSPSGLQKTWSTLVTTRCYPSLSSMISNGKMKESFN